MRIKRKRRRPKKKRSSFQNCPQILVFISKIVQFFTIFEVKTKKQKRKVFVARSTRNFMKSSVSHHKNYKNTVSSCSRTVRRKALFCESQVSICSPVAPRLLISSGHSSSLKAKLSFGGYKQSFGGARPQIAPRGAGPKRRTPKKHFLLKKFNHQRLGYT